MRILLLSDINSPHTQKWAIALSNKGIEIGIFSLSIPSTEWYKTITNIHLLSNSGIDNTIFNSSILSKMAYLKTLPHLRKAIKKFNPDIAHAHYATSYGLLGALSGFKPFIISAWGSDVMDFPNKSYFHKLLLRYILNTANLVFATSDAIVNSINKVAKVSTMKIPFGINLNEFKPFQVKKIFSDTTIVVGTIKSLVPIYGIDILIKSFKIVLEKHPEVQLKLLIIGEGSNKGEYKEMVRNLNIEPHVLFLGKVAYQKVAEYHNMIDIFINVSRNESFGVSVIEASACEKPVIVTNVGGLVEVVERNRTGIVVEKENIKQTVLAIESLLDKSLRKIYGERGRLFVAENFDFAKNIDETITVYNSFINN